MFKRKRNINVYPDDFIRLMLCAYTRVAKTCLRTGDAAGYRRASDQMHEVTRCI